MRSSGRRRGGERVVVATANGVGGDGFRSGEENRGGGECFGERMRTRESEEERQGGAWRLRASRRKQEVAEASRARATPRLCPSGEGGR